VEAARKNRVKRFVIDGEAVWIGRRMNRRHPAMQRVMEALA
jgi:hypothetical protein